MVAKNPSVKPDLNDLEKLKPIMEKVIKKSKVSIISKKFHKFKPQGLTGFYLLSESHLSFHTWPELGSISIDFYTCGDSHLADNAINNLITERIIKWHKKYLMI